jgi:hypothetical protein
MLSRLLALVHGKDEKITETKVETTVEKPTKEQIMAVVGRFKLNAADRLFVKPEDGPSVDFLERLGLVKTESEFSLSPKTGQIEQRRFARWLSWNCEDCVNFFVGDMKTKPSLVADEVVLKNVPQCRRGFSMEFRDGRKGKRCPYFEDKRLKEALAQWG